MFMEKGLTLGIASALSLISENEVFLISGSLVTPSHLEILTWGCGGQSWVSLGCCCTNLWGSPEFCRSLDFRIMMWMDPYLRDRFMGHFGKETLKIQSKKRWGIDTSAPKSSCLDSMCFSLHVHIVFWLFPSSPGLEINTGIMSRALPAPTPSRPDWVFTPIWWVLSHCLCLFWVTFFQKPPEQIYRTFRKGKLR